MGTEMPGSLERLTAAPAAVADEVHAFTGVFAKLDEVVPLRHGEQIKAFGGVHLPGVAVFDERSGRGVECHADIHRGVARPPKVLHFMAAVAHADADVRAVLMMCEARS